MQEYLHFLRLIRKELYVAIFGVFMSFIASLSSIALMSLATWLLTAMAIAGFYDYALNIFIQSAMIRLFALCRTLLRYGERYYTHDATFRILAYLRVFLFERALDLKLEQALKLKSSDLQRRMHTDLERLEMIYIRQFVPFACAFLIGMVVGGILIYYSFLMAITALSFMFLAGVAIPVLLARLAKTESQNLALVAVELNDKISTLVHCLFDLTLLSQQGKYAQDFLNRALELAKSRSRLVFFDQFAQVVLLTCAELTLVFLLIQGVPLISSGDISPAMLMMCAVGAMAAFEVIVPLSAAFLHLEQVKASAKRVSALLNITKENAEIDKSFDAVLQEDDDSNDKFLKQEQQESAKLVRSLKEAAVSMTQSVTSDNPYMATKRYQEQLLAQNDQKIKQNVLKEQYSTNSQNCNQIARKQDAKDYSIVEVKDLSFSYKLNTTKDTKISESLKLFEHNSFTFRSDKNYVIKAPSGRGKSTLVYLITNLLYPTVGELYLNGQAYSSLKGSQIRSHFAVATQDITLFSGSIFDIFKQVKPNVTKEEVLDVLAIVELLDLIADLPHGLEEWLGSAGLTISGGQARRLCLARAMIKPEYDFIILDEPGEGLDEVQEESIMERIQSLRKGVIMITHKQAGLKLADEIIYI